MSKTKRVSMTLPIKLADDLDMISKTFNVSRSSLVSGILSDAVEPIKEVIRLSMSALEESDSEDTNPLSRKPEKVRAFLDALNSVAESEKSQLDAKMQNIFDEAKENNNAH
jgi:hypothetical protein